MKCKICGGTVWSGVVLHPHCFEQLQPVWHPGCEKPPTHIEIIRIDDENEPVEISGEFLCEYGEEAEHCVAKFYAGDEHCGDSWVKKDGTVIKPTRWMVIPK